MTVQQSIDRWGAQKLAKAGQPVPDGTSITLTEELPSMNFCDTCGPDPMKVTISGGGRSTYEYMSMGDVIAEILAVEKGVQSHRGVTVPAPVGATITTTSIPTYRKIGTP